MKSWHIRARIYRWFRRIFPINLLYSDEVDNLLGLLEHLSYNPRRILDLGTGIGDSLPYLPRGKQRFLLDSSAAMLTRIPASQCEQKIYADALQLPFKKQQFDLITCIGVSEYIRPKARLLREIYECLKPNGYAIITFSPKGLLTQLRKLLGKRIFPLSGSTAIDLFAAQNFFVVWSYRSTIQSQYLVQRL